MKALVLEEYKKLVYRDVTDPVIPDNEVLVKVKACGICGYHSVSDNIPVRFPLSSSP